AFSSCRRDRGMDYERLQIMPPHVVGERREEPFVFLGFGLSFPAGAGKASSPPPSKLTPLVGRTSPFPPRPLQLLSDGNANGESKLPRSVMEDPGFLGKGVKWSCKYTFTSSGIPYPYVRSRNVRSDFKSQWSTSRGS